jgi:peptidoglycan-associated lipoprotein
VRQEADGHLVDGAGPGRRHRWRHVEWRRRRRAVGGSDAGRWRRRTVRRDGGWCASDIHFDYDKADIREADAKILDAKADWLKARADHLLLIEGHCDSRGTNEYNTALGDRRAKATMNYLVSRGVQATRITVISYGEERPVCAEQSEGCWAKNRRAHFLVKPR